MTGTWLVAIIIIIIVVVVVINITSVHVIMAYINDIIHTDNASFEWTILSIIFLWFSICIIEGNMFYENWKFGD